MYWWLSVMIHSFSSCRAWNVQIMVKMHGFCPSGEVCLRQTEWGKLLIWMFVVLRRCIKYNNQIGSTAKRRTCHGRCGCRISSKTPFSPSFPPKKWWSLILKDSYSEWLHLKGPLCPTTSKAHPISWQPFQKNHSSSSFRLWQGLETQLLPRLAR